MRLFVDIEGPGLVPNGPAMRKKPTLILLHGGPGYDHSSFKPLFIRLADLVQIVYLDHRGHGRSDRRPSTEWTLDTFADDVVRLCAVLGIERPIVLGQSFGGFVAQRYLARQPAHPAVSARTVHVEDILFTSAGGEQQTMQLLPGLARVQCPVLVMAGGLDLVTPMADAEDIAAAIPAPWAELVRFPNAGHGAWRDEPEPALAVLRRFLAAAT